MDPYNPLDKRNLGRSVAEALLEGELVPLPTSGDPAFTGAGVYAIYYFGVHLPYPPYQRLADHNRTSSEPVPIYVGKAIPRGARTAGVGLDANPGTALFGRLQEHGESIESANNLDFSDFRCQCLLVDDIWIPLGESLLIQRFKPVWNVLVGGFGNHDPGAGRRSQRRSAWDTIHSGRAWAELLPNPYQLSVEAINQQIKEFLAGEAVPIKTTIEAIEDEET